MVTPMELTKQTTAALVAFLKNPMFEWPPSLFDGGKLRIHPGQSDEVNDGQTIRVFTDDELGDETPLYTGNFPVVVRVELRTPATVTTQEEKDAGKVSGLTFHDLAAASLHWGIMQNEFPDELNAAVDTYNAANPAERIEFTCFGVSQRRPYREPSGEVFVSGFVVEILACPEEFR